jgi:tetratricopeptide (TPR) repeat protein
MKCPDGIKLTSRAVSFLQISSIIILGIVIYINCSGGGFVWDDHGLIKENTYIRNWSNLPKIFSASFGSGGGATSNFYRPLQAFIQMAGYFLWGAHPAGYHLISIFTHILAAILFYLLLRNIFYHKSLSFLASLLFLSCPINTEAVCYISGLSDPLSLVFMLTSFILYLRALPTKNLKLHTLALFSFSLALLSKENAVVLPFFILVYHYAFNKKIEIKRFLFFFGVLIAYLVFRLLIFKSSGQSDFIFDGIWKRIPIFFAGIAQYLRILLLPVDLHVEYTHQLFNFTDFLAILGFILAVSLIIYAFVGRKSNPVFFFAVAWFFIAFLPVSNIYPISYSFIMEHYLYVPALGFFIILSGLPGVYSRNGILKTSLFLLAVVLIILYSYLTIRQTDYWKKPIFFYERTLSYAPRSWRFYNELGIEYASIGNSLKAESSYQEALKINPSALGVYDNLSSLYGKIGDQKKLFAARKEENEVRLELIRKDYEVVSSLKNAGRYKEVAVILKKILAFDQSNLAVRVELANTHVLTGDYKDALELFEAILKAKPDFALGYNNLCVVYFYLKRYDLAINNYDKAIALGYPVAPELINLLKPYKK